MIWRVAPPSWRVKTPSYLPSSLRTAEVELPTLLTACSNSSRLTPRCRARYFTSFVSLAVMRSRRRVTFLLFLEANMKLLFLAAWPQAQLERALRPAKEPAQRQGNSNGGVRSVFDRITNDVLER